MTNSEGHCGPVGPICRSIADLDEPLIKEDLFYPVSGASVIWADYQLVRQHLGDILGRRRSASDIDKFLCDSASVMSETQVASDAVSQSIPVSGPPRKGWRPPDMVGLQYLKYSHRAK
jgi:hypothetical protein